ncbi:hypothetical protein [Tibeticola sp.]|uniref:hypothetical protein n=1 Tax=Tibeticola sp. TaxID=2005368 RepID=UPI0025DB58AB|nr:hypothetical protein [Tibeticola sp.]
MPHLLPLRPASAVLVAALITFGGTLTPAPASAADDGAAATVQPKKPKKHRKHKQQPIADADSPRHRAIFDRGSAETTAERDRRLRRECKGRPNAGACLGYAS